VNVAVYGYVSETLESADVVRDSVVDVFTFAWPATITNVCFVQDSVTFRKRRW